MGGCCTGDDNLSSAIQPVLRVPADPVGRARIAEIVRVLAGICAAVCGLSGPLLRLAEWLERRKAPKPTAAPRRSPRRPAPSKSEEVQFTDLDSQVARAALQRAGFLPPGRPR